MLEWDDGESWAWRFLDIDSTLFGEWAAVIEVFGFSSMRRAIEAWGKSF